MLSLAGVSTQTHLHLQTRGGAQIQNISGNIWKNIICDDFSLPLLSFYNFYMAQSE